MSFTTEAARDTLLPSGSRKAGMLAWIRSINRFMKVAADGGAWSPLIQIDSVTFVGTDPIVGSVDPTKPYKLWVVNKSYVTDGNGDVALLTAAQIGSGCVIAGSFAGTWTDMSGTTVDIRGVSGALWGRVRVNNATAVSSTRFLTGLVLGQ